MRVCSRNRPGYFRPDESPVKSRAPAGSGSGRWWSARMARSGRGSTARLGPRRNASGSGAGGTRLISGAVDRSPSGPVSRATAPSARSAPIVRAADRRASHGRAPNVRRPGATWRECVAFRRGRSVHLLTSGPPSVWSRPSSERQSAVVVTRRPCLAHVPHRSRRAARPDRRRWPTTDPGGKGPSERPVTPCAEAPEPTLPANAPQAPAYPRGPPMHAFPPPRTQREIAHEEPHRRAEPPPARQQRT